MKWAHTFCEGDRSSFNVISIPQGRRRVFKSGPAGEIIECRRHVRGGGGELERGAPPLFRGVRGLPREKFEFLALLCAF